MRKILTISIAGYNVEQFIENTLDSLLITEILEDIEILVCDDGGTDTTASIVKQYEDRYPQTVKLIHKSNGGYGSVINTNVNHATGKYFKQLDGDDWFESSNLIGFISFLKSVDADYIITPVIEFNEESKHKTLKNRFVEFNEKYDLNAKDFNNFSSMHESTFKTSILKSMNLNITEHCFYTDTEYVISVIPFVNSVWFFNNPIYVYRIGREGQSVSLEGIKKHYKDHEIVFWKNLEVYKQLEGNKKRFVLYRLRKELATHFKYYCLLPLSLNNFRGLCKFYENVKTKCPDVLQEGITYSRFVALIHYSKCYLYGLYCLLVRL